MNSILKVKDPTTKEWINIPVIGGPQGDAGITPHIGNNGNWFIGTTDTGVLARGENGLDAPQESILYIEQNLTSEQQEQARNNIGAIPAPDTAEVGQTIVVKAVDENGVPTEWKAVDLPDGGSGGGSDSSKDFKLISFLTIADDVSVIDISVADDGKSIADKRLTEVGVQLYLPVMSGNTEDHDVAVTMWYPPDAYGTYTIKSAITTSNRWYMLDMRAMGVPVIYAFSQEGTFNGGGTSNLIYTSIGPHSTENLDPYTYHRGFKFTAKDTTFPIGTKIRIFGR